MVMKIDLTAFSALGNTPHAAQRQPGAVAVTIEGANPSAAIVYGGCVRSGNADLITIAETAPPELQQHVDTRTWAAIREDVTAGLIPLSKLKATFKRAQGISMIFFLLVAVGFIVGETQVHTPEANCLLVLVNVLLLLPMFSYLYLMAKFLHDFEPAFKAVVDGLNAKHSPRLAFAMGWDIRFGRKGRRTRLWHLDVMVGGSQGVPQAAVAQFAVPVDTTGDGIANAVMFDTTGDGKLDRVVPMAAAQAAPPPMVVAAAPVIVNAVPVVVTATPVPSADRGEKMD